MVVRPIEAVRGEEGFDRLRVAGGGKARGEDDEGRQVMRMGLHRLRRHYSCPTLSPDDLRQAVPDSASALLGARSLCLLSSRLAVLENELEAVLAPSRCLW